MPRTTPHKSRFNDVVKDATIVTLRRIIDPLVDLMLDAGVTVHEFSYLVRERAVRNAARRVTKENGRDSKSRVAIVTGLPRSEVARILKTDEVSYNTGLGQHPARKVLTAWFDNPRFLAANGEPAVLPIFGKRRSFEQLVAMHSRGIPVRAMLDELTQTEAVERLPDQRVRANSRTPILTGLTSSSIKAIGERTRDLLKTLTHNVRRPSKPLFEGTALVDENDLEIVSLVRREIQEQGANFVNSANALFKRSCIKPYVGNPKSSAKVRLGVTVYYFQDDIEDMEGSKTEAAQKRRKNLQRQLRPRRI
jgi:hypothetical protein